MARRYHGRAAEYKIVRRACRVTCNVLNRSVVLGVGGRGLARITTIFFDLGGVCLSNGWDHDQRKVVAGDLGFDYEAFDSRHQQVADSLERGHLSLEDYLQRTIFYESRSFTKEDVVEAIQRQSTPF